MKIECPYCGSKNVLKCWDKVICGSCHEVIMIEPRDFFLEAEEELNFDEED